MTIKTIIILGGEFSAYVSAAFLANALLKNNVKICLIETRHPSPGNALAASEDIALTLAPQTQVLHEILGLDEASILANANGTFSYGHLYQNWQHNKPDFLQTYDNYGVDFGAIDFQHFYSKFKDTLQLPNYDNFSLSAKAGKDKKFSHPNNDKNSILSTLSYGLNLECNRYTTALKHYAEKLGVEIKYGTFLKSKLDNTGHVESLVMKDGEVRGDLYIDCSGSASLLLEQSLNIKNVCWGKYFHCKRKVQYLQKHSASLAPYSTIKTHENFWQKTVPLKSHTVNTGFFNSDDLDENAIIKLLPSEELYFSDSKTGHKQELWKNNVIALGAAAINMEALPLSTMDVLYENLKSLLALLPVSNSSEANAKEYNRINIDIYQNLRDYQLCHYALNTLRQDSTFWRNCVLKDIPDSLEHRLHLFRERGSVVPKDADIFPPAMWTSLLLGLGLLPESYDPLVDNMDESGLIDRINRMQGIINQSVKKMPLHADYLEHYLRNK